MMMMMMMMNNHILKRLLLVLSVILCSLVTTTNASVTTQIDLSSLKGEEWMKACKNSGFDPSQLACNTCRLLPSQHKATCQECCQSYKDTQSLRKPYQSAVILVPKQGAESELENFLNEDWAELAQKRGGPARLQHVALADNGQQQMQGFWFLRAPPAELLFLDEPLPNYSGGISEATARNKATETISLYGWKREDIKDMIETLLVK